jgi:D-alanyl-D-alanine dipeptidase
VTELVLMGDPRVAAVPVNDCGDELIDTRHLAGLDVAPNDDPRNTAHSFLRRSVAERLLQAQSALPSGLRILVAEGYRPYDLQEFDFSRRRRRLLDGDPTLSDEDAFLKASEGVSPPEVAPHVSGAAVDLPLVDERGQALDMGTPINDSPEESEGACYFDAENITAEARRNRDTLAGALLGAGLVNYPAEWWHWSYGDRYWALMTEHRHAIFGPMHPTTEIPTRL